MPIPDRPVDDAEIATDWGQEIHDRTFAPKGCLLTGSGVTVADNTFVQIPIDGATEDPGGWLDDPVAEAPVGAEGLYIFSGVFQTDDLDAAASLRCYLKVNGAEIARVDALGDDSVQINLPVSGHVVIAAGDQFAAYAKKIGTAGPSVTVSLVSLSLIRVGNEYGA